MNEEKYEEQGISLSDLLFLVKKNLILIFVITGCCALISGVYGFLIKQITYTATTSLIIDADPSSSGSSSSSEYNYYSYSVNLTNTFKEFIVDDAVLRVALEDLQAKYPELTVQKIKDVITITTSTSSSIMKISAATNDSQMSIDIANAVSNCAIECADASGTVSLVDKLKVYGPAIETTAKRGAALVCVIAVLVGLVGSFAIILIKYLTDNTYTSKDAFEKTFNINILACLQDAEGGE